MSIKCLFGFHDWGRQENIRDQKLDDRFVRFAFFFAPLILIAALFGAFRECDRTCLRCGKTKTFPYDSNK